MNIHRRLAPLTLLVPLALASPIQAESTAVNLRDSKPAEAPEAPAPANDDALVQVALLLDTSGSMEGLIDQARCQLWNVVNELSKSTRKGQPTRLEIAVYKYGSEFLNEDTGFIRQVTGFTDDLDTVSKALFSLKVKGGEEFCGQVIYQALTELRWKPDPNVYKVIFIAGNESFDQGNVKFGQALPKALDGDVVVNSIYCFDPKSTGSAPKTTPGGATAGMEQWEAAAKLTYGKYFQINHNHHLPDMETPYDGKMRELNKKMNETFIWFGEGAQHARENQNHQDENAHKMSDHAFAARMSAKIGHLYHHMHHDLVDAIAHDMVDLATMPEAKMPELMKKLTPAERMEMLEEKAQQRKAIQRQMADVITARHRFLEEKMSEKISGSANGSLVLGDALAEAVREQAERRGYVFAD